MNGLRKKIMDFSIKHAKTITKFIPKPIINFAERLVVKGVDFKRTTEINPKLKKGVNLVGHLKARTGLGQGARMLARALKRSKYKYSLIDTKYGTDKSYADTEFDNELSKEFPYNINLIDVQPHVNFQETINQIGIDSLKGRYNIGYWVYEIENIPKKWFDTFKYVNEIWTPSEFVSDAFRKVSPVPVYTIPHSVETKVNKKLKRKDFNIPDDKFVYLCLYDQKSSTERKNPQAIINAYKKAFDKNEKNVFLVIKMNKATEEEINAIKNDLNGIKNYTIINDSLPIDDLYSLISLCDVYVSLHRSEGFGLVMAEAMSLGTVCIATNYSGNLQFMNKENSMLVDYKLVKTKLKNDYVYSYNDIWADADVDQASEYMKELLNNKKLYKKLKDNAQKTILNEFSIESLTKKVEKRIDEIIKEKKKAVK